MKEQLFWNPEVDSGEWWASWAWVLIFPFYPFIPLGAWILYERYKKFPIYRENRRKTFEMTSSKLMSKVEYVGGHPLIPQATTVVIGLSETHFTIYSIDTEFEAKKTFLENYTKKKMLSRL